MLIKVLGAGLVLCSSTAIGFWCANHLKERIEELETIRKLLLMLRGEIKYSHSTLSEAFCSIGKRLKEPYGGLLSQVAERMDVMQGQTLSQIWEECVAEGMKESALTREDQEKLVCLGNQLGYLDTEMQVNTIELYLEQVEEEIKNAADSFKRNGKLYRTMGVMAGVFLVILML